TRAKKARKVTRAKKVKKATRAKKVIPRGMSGRVQPCALNSLMAAGGRWLISVGRKATRETRAPCQGMSGKVLPSVFKIRTEPGPAHGLISRENLLIMLR